MASLVTALKFTNYLVLNKLLLISVLQSIEYLPSIELKQNLMKTIITIIIAGLFFTTGFAQYIQYEHAGGRAAIYKKAKLKEVQRVGEFIPAIYWDAIKDISVEISGTCNGVQLKVSNNSDELSVMQRKLLASADFDTEVFVKVTLNYKDLADNSTKSKDIEYVITPGPESEAMFEGGEEKMQKYLTENYIKKITAIDLSKNSLPQITVAFTVNEDGQLTDIAIQRSSDPQLDKLILAALNNMPKWKPAENKGVKVKEKFKFSVGMGGC
jgi:TonB family protein